MTLGKWNRKPVFGALSIWVVGVVLASCNAQETPTPSTTLRLLNWAGYLPDSVLEAYTSETGFAVDNIYYDNYDDAVAKIRNGDAVDVAVIGNDYVPGLIHEDLLAEIDYHNIPNFNNIAANFRDLALDPGNRHSVPWWWETTGILYRTDLGLPRPTRWADLWRAEYQGHVALWDLPREGTMVALKALGFPANSEVPADLHRAREHLLALKPYAVVPPSDVPTIAPYLAQGDVWVSFAWPFDLTKAQALGLAVDYVLPQDGSLLWGENLVIPRTALNKTAAEGFINFLLRPTISAEISLALAGNIPNEAALDLLPEAFLADPVVFPTEGDVQGAEVVLPVGETTNAYILETWGSFMAGKSYLSMP